MIFFTGRFFKTHISKKTAVCAIVQRLSIIWIIYTLIEYYNDPLFIAVATFSMCNLLIRLAKNENFILQGLYDNYNKFRKAGIFLLFLLFPTGDFKYLLEGKSCEVYAFIQPQKNIQNIEEIRLFPLFDSFSLWWNNSYKKYVNHEINI